VTCAGEESLRLAEVVLHVDHKKRGARRIQVELREVGHATIVQRTIVAVDGVHDLGGMHGFGAVPVHDDATFHASWERRIFGIQLQMAARGTPRNLDESRFDIERLDPAFYLSAGYFERWLVANELRLVRRGILTAEELEARRRELAETSEPALPSNPDPAFADALVATTYRSAPTSRKTDAAPRFAVGDAVLTSNDHPAAHTRLPRYARGRRGAIERVYEAFGLPELASVGRERPEFVYAVRFDARELWGASADPKSTVCLDLWESYLSPA
jgi:nitrile hydratase